MMTIAASATSHPVIDLNHFIFALLSKKKRYFATGNTAGSVLRESISGPLIAFSLPQRTHGFTAL
jgi:hypothetical protein